MRHHIKQLIQQRDDEFIPEKINMLNNRIKNLSAVCAEVALGPELGSRRADIGRHIGAGVRIFNGVCQFGVIDVADLLQDSNKIQEFKIIKKVFVQLQECSVKHVPAEAVIVGWQTGCAVAASIASTSAFLIQDQAFKNGTH